jgi:signal transduction histidine kinase
VRIVSPLTAIQRVAEHMAKGQLDVRAEVSHSSLELASLGRSFNHMASEIEAMMTRQREFVANASHELRSPLATIKLRAEALAAGGVAGDRAKQYVVEINDETTRLGCLVADLLHLSRIDSQNFTRPAEALHVADELTTSLRAIRPRAMARHQEIAADVQSDIPDVFIQPNDLRVMVDNLLDNAVKYTPDRGQISLSAHWKDTTLYIEVCDTGEGIPKEDLPRVTERFFRVDRAHTRGTTGTGLGLALVVATAQQYGGNLTLESNGTPGHGTRASLSLRPEYLAGT